MTTLPPCKGCERDDCSCPICNRTGVAQHRGFTTQCDHCAGILVRSLRSQLAKALERAEVAERELASAKARRFPVLDGGMTVPWQMLAPHEQQARANHDQTLERLASRGGLGWAEMLAVLEGKGLRFVRETTDEVARPRVLARVAEFEHGPAEMHRENTAWRALAEWEFGDTPEQRDRCVCVNSGPGSPTILAEWDYPYEPPDDGHMVVAGYGATYAASAVDLAGKLGLLDAALPPAGGYWVTLIRAGGR